MSSEITINLDNNLLDVLSMSAKEKGHTLSEEIQYRLMLIPVEIKESAATKTVSSKLRGIIHLPKDFDYKKELENRDV